MSTTIYNGYKINVTTLNQFNEINQKIKQAIHKHNHNNIKQLYIGILTRIYDEYCIAGKNGVKEIAEDFIFLANNTNNKELNFMSLNNLIYSIFKIHDDYNKTNMYEKSWMFNLNNDAVYFLKNDKILAIFYMDKCDDIFKNIPEIEFYGYWDNVDPDETCTHEQWEERRKDWEDVLNPSWKPSNEGIVVNYSGNLTELLCSEFFSNQQKILDEINSNFDKRVEKLAIKKIEESEREEINKRYSKDDDKPLYNAYIHLKAKKHMDEWRKTEEYKQLLENEKRFFQSKLNNNITKKNIEEVILKDEKD